MLNLLTIRTGKPNIWTISCPSRSFRTNSQRSITSTGTAPVIPMRSLRKTRKQPACSQPASIPPASSSTHRRDSQTATVSDSARKSASAHRSFTREALSVWKGCVRINTSSTETEILSQITRTGKSSLPIKKLPLNNASLKKLFEVYASKGFFRLPDCPPDSAFSVLTSFRFPHFFQITEHPDQMTDPVADASQMRLPGSPVAS